MCTTRTPGARCAGPRGTSRSAGAARRSRSATPCSLRPARSSGSSASTRVQARLDVHAARRSPRAARRATPAVELAARSARRRSAAVGAPLGRLGHAWPRSAPAARSRARPRPRARPAWRRVDHGHDLARAVADDAVAGLAVGRLEQALGEDRELLAHAGATPRPGASESTTRPSSKPSPRNGLVARAAGGRRGRPSRPAARAARPGAMPSSDSIMQPSMTRSSSARAACDHPHRLADAAGTWRA